ncbi:MAG: hypothetical protein Q8930_04280 [Bacillota bacterium]|nr:hypothetical protein [Bacillota bacterium]
MNDQMSGYRRKMALLGQRMLAEEEGDMTADSSIKEQIDEEREKSFRENQNVHNEFK